MVALDDAIDNQRADCSWALDRLPALFPDFVAADHLFYPLSVCHSLAVLLRNSNVAYPESSRKIGALDLGWLRRV